MMTAIQPHIERATDGVLYVAGTPYKVKSLILEHIAWKMDAVEIRDGHPGLTLGDAHAVLTYFYDNESAVRREVEDDLKAFDEMRQLNSPQPSREELRKRLDDLNLKGARR